MSIPVPLAELTATIERYPIAYLLTADDGRVHAVSVNLAVRADRLRVDRLGRRTLANVAQQPNVTLLWPPTDPGDYSLIVDGTAELVRTGAAPMPHNQVTPDGDDLWVTPTRAVLHRPAPPVETGPSDDDQSCASDCIEVPILGTTG